MSAREKEFLAGSASDEPSDDESSDDDSVDSPQLGNEVT